MKIIVTFADRNYPEQGAKYFFRALYVLFFFHLSAGSMKMLTFRTS